MAEKQGGKVLVITDGEKEEFSGTLSFKDEKIEVHPFSKAPDAIKDCQVDLILLDCNVDVEEALKILKENKTSCPNIPNIFITDVSLEGVVLRAFRAGARDFFRKPVNMPELKDTIEGLLSVRKSSQEKRSPFIKTAS
ncbi:MAG TPA: response regulator [Thermodesulfovibrionales bacterium]|jgi:DNA-binding response OmpR family regulator|nr:response regulator [Thermodesulfovibrionales bacterium]